MGVPIFTAEGFEADDVIGTLAAKAAAAGFQVAIVTGDKDFFQLVGDGIRVYNPRDEGAWFDEAGVSEKFGVAPAQVVDVLALMGDTIDNVKGVPGIGEKGARDLISHLRIARRAARARRRRAAEEVPRGAADQRGPGAAEPRAGEDSRRRGRRRSSPSGSGSAARAASAATRCSRSWGSARWSPSTRRPRIRSCKDYAVVESLDGAARRWSAEIRDRRGWRCG